MNHQEQNSQEQEFKLTGKPAVAACDLRQEDFTHCLELQERAKGKGKRYVQMAAAGVLAVGFLISWFLDKEYWAGLGLGVFSLLLLGMLLFLPPVLLKKTAAMLAEQYKRLEYSFYENGVRVHDGMFPLDIPLERLAIYGDDAYLVLETTGNRLYPLPRRALTGEEGKKAEDAAEGYPGYYRFEAGGSNPGGNDGEK